jgi:SHS2 domain-containing protein
MVDASHSRGSVDPEVVEIIPVSSPSGRRSVPHQSDVRIEAWAPSREECVAQAVLAVVESFADTTTAAQTGVVDLPVAADSCDDMLAGVLDEVICLLDTVGRLPVDVQVRRLDGGLDIRMRMTDLDRAQLVGSPPKGVALCELRFGRRAAAWSCQATLKV